MAWAILQSILAFGWLELDSGTTSHHRFEDVNHQFNCMAALKFLQLCSITRHQNAQVEERCHTDPSDRLADTVSDSED